MTVLEKASCHVCWQEFLDYKAERQQLYPEEEKELREFVERRAYLPLCEAWERGEYPAQYPVKKEINKQGVRKKRIVYTFPGDEGVFLKFVAFQLYAFDGHFCENCYAFRRRFGVRDAIRRIRHLPGLEEKYCLKADISDYFNSIPVEKLLERLLFVREADPKLYDLFERILGREEVWEDGRLVVGRHGAMAGIPLSPFFANVYLGEADAFFQERDIPYFRYSDDILIFADTERELSDRQEQLYGMLEGLGLSLNPRKVQVRGPGEAWEFLGFCYRKGEIDLSDATLRKMKAKVRRKAEALRRWQRKKGLGADKAAIGLIHAMNRKFYGAKWLCRKYRLRYRENRHWERHRFRGKRKAYGRCHRLRGRRKAHGRYRRLRDRRRENAGKHRFRNRNREYERKRKSEWGQRFHMEPLVFPQHYYGRGAPGDRRLFYGIYTIHGHRTALQGKLPHFLCAAESLGLQEPGA